MDDHRQNFRRNDKFLVWKKTTSHENQWFDERTVCVFNPCLHFVLSLQFELCASLNPGCSLHFVLMVPNSTFLLSSKTAHYSVERVCMHLTIVISTWNISGQLPVCCRLYIYWCRVYTKLVYIINWALLTSKTSFRGAGVVVFINWCSSLVVITGTLGNCLLITPITNRMAAISMLWLGDCVTKS